MEICQIGLGYWGKNHARVLGEFKTKGYVDEVYYYDIDTELMEKTAKLHRGKTVSDLSNLDVDLVDIVVPANYHYQVALPFVERGVHTFIEKPFTDRSEDAQHLIDVADDPATQIMIGHIFRYHVGVQFARELVERGTIGKLQKMDIRRLAFSKPRTDNGVVFSLAIHDLDLFNYFQNETLPDYVEALTSTIMGPTEDHAFIKVGYPDVVGVAEESWMSPEISKVRKCSLQGSEGQIIFNFSDPSKVTVNSKYLEASGHLIDEGLFTHAIDYDEPLSKELLHFIEQSTNKEKYDSGPFVGMRAVKLCEKVLEASTTGKRLYLID